MTRPPPSFDVPLDPRRCALLVIDMQVDFCSPEGVLHRQLGADVSGIAPVVPVIERLGAAARRSGVPVLFVRTTDDETTDSPAFAGRPIGGGQAYLCLTGPASGPSAENVNAGGR
jgi:ureidoacrylate peracid hydrolase